MGKIYFLSRGISLFLIVLLLVVSCSTLPTPDEIEYEPGFYYGKGSGTTQANATKEAKKDLIKLAIGKTREAAGLSGIVMITDDMVNSLDLSSLKIIAMDNSNGLWTVVCRVKEKDWNEYQLKRIESTRADIIPDLLKIKLSSDISFSDRIKEIASIVNRLYIEMLFDILTEEAGGGRLILDSCEDIAEKEFSTLKFEMETIPGFVEVSTGFNGRLITQSDTGRVPILATWTVRGEEPITIKLLTSEDGYFTINFPDNPQFYNRSVKLTLRTGFFDDTYSSDFLQKLELSTETSFFYQCFENIDKYFFENEVFVPGGDYKIGAVEGDVYATQKEASRTVTLKSFYMDKFLVTNSLWAMYLDSIGSDSYPEYWDNPDYNQYDQPVIGVSYDEAVAFSKWLSEKLGVVKRLPTEEEWEVAARGGQDIIFPWGNESPADGQYANYDGEDNFFGTSPVGSFPDGVNSLGLYDMAGNVWQWTSSPCSTSGNKNIVKGGGWMDGPQELRISNKRCLTKSKGYVDVGIRLIREVTENEN
ncbi:SUMF1/EgtB/PvdO family nonheme iron enzyme [Spirochaetia bacterium 38H-sp]|uniref:SUMF1/EgtB/PvdO family nonheme iron enzyme n=1 Tax=Rarispira pelagica TaxID=3141764 RepID=A0ABU9UCR8_9SPIR